MADEFHGDRSRDPLAAPRRSRSGRMRTGGVDSRQHRRALERARVRRRRVQRTVVLFSLIALAAVAYLGVSRIRWGGDGSVAQSTTTVAAADGSAVLLRVMQGEETRVAVLMAPAAQPALLIGLPADVLIRASTGFDPLRTFLDAPQDEEAAFEEAAGGIEALLGVRPDARAQVLWTDLLKAASAIGAGATAPEELAPDDAKSATAVLTLLKALLGAAGTTEGDAALAAVPVAGGEESARAALRSLDVRTALTSAIPGRPVEGSGFSYFEPDVPGLQTMLGGEAPESAVSVEVQNGSGVVGAAQKISDAIAPLGYTVLPPKNAEGFPDVQATQLLAAPDVLAEANRLRGLLGQGTVVQQDALPAGHVIIVVGKDLDVDALPAPGG